jgi:hypothetical protein
MFFCRTATSEEPSDHDENSDNNQQNRGRHVSAVQKREIIFINGVGHGSCHNHPDSTHLQAHLHFVEKLLEEETNAEERQIRISTYEKKEIEE